MKDVLAIFLICAVIIGFFACFVVMRYVATLDKKEQLQFCIDNNIELTECEKYFSWQDKN